MAASDQHLRDGAFERSFACVGHLWRAICSALLSPLGPLLKPAFGFAGDGRLERCPLSEVRSLLPMEPCVYKISQAELTQERARRFVDVDELQAWPENDRLEIHVAAFRRENGRAPNADELIRLLLSEIALPGVTREDEFEIGRLADSIAANGVRVPPIVDHRGVPQDGNRRLAACRYILNSGKFDNAAKERARTLRVWKMSEYADAVDYRAVVIGLNFEPSEKIDWPEYIKGRRVAEDWDRMLSAEGSEPNQTRRTELRKELAARFVIATDRVDRYLKMVDWSDRFEEHHRDIGRGEQEVQQKASEWFQYFAEMSIGKSEGGVNHTLINDEQLRSLTFDLLYDGKIKAFPLIRELPKVARSAEARDLLVEGSGHARDRRRPQAGPDAQSRPGKGRRRRRQSTGRGRRDPSSWRRPEDQDLRQLAQEGAGRRLRGTGRDEDSQRPRRGVRPDDPARATSDREALGVTKVVTVSASLRGGVVLVPRTRADRFAVASAVRSLGLEPYLEAGRIHLDTIGATRLLDGVEGIDLRWDDDARDHVGGRIRATAGRVVVAEAMRSLDEGGVTVAREMLADVDLLAALDNHQVVNVAAMTTPRGHGLCLFDEQGAGKTVSVVAAFDVLAQRDEADFMLVLAPKPMLAEWKRHIDRFTPVYRVAVYAGSHAERRYAISLRPDVVVANYEAAVNDAGPLTAAVARHGHRGVLVVDESFHVKNAATSGSQATLRLRRRMGRTYVLCGTPAPNRADDVVAQVSLVDFGLTFDGVTVPEDREQAVPVVRAALEASPLHRRNLKVDVLPDLAEREYTRISLGLAPRQRALYDAAELDLVDELRHVGDREFAASLTTWSARRSALLRLCSNPAGLVDGYDEEPAKLVALDRIIERFVRNGDEKLVVWSFFTASLAAIAARYADLGAVRYDGSVTSVDDRARAVRAFQEDTETRIFVANPAAAGAGLTLHAARLAVYESLSNQAAHYLQSLDRIHRRGQLRDVEYFFLVADDTLESAEYDRLSRKHAAARDLLGDEDPVPVTRERLPADLVRMTPEHRDRTRLLDSSRCWPASTRRRPPRRSCPRRRTRLVSASRTVHRRRQARRPAGLGRHLPPAPPLRLLGRHFPVPPEPAARPRAGYTIHVRCRLATRRTGPCRRRRAALRTSHSYAIRLYLGRRDRGIVGARRIVVSSTAGPDDSRHCLRE